MATLRELHADPDEKMKGDESNNDIESPLFSTPRHTRPFYTENYIDEPTKMPDYPNEEMEPVENWSVSGIGARSAECHQRVEDEKSHDYDSEDRMEENFAVRPHDQSFGVQEDKNECSDRQGNCQNHQKLMASKPGHAATASSAPNRLVVSGDKRTDTSRKYKRYGHKRHVKIPEEIAWGYRRPCYGILGEIYLIGWN